MAKKILHVGGEGSRGGHVIGHTKSGKPIYDHAPRRKRLARTIATQGKERFSPIEELEQFKKEHHDWSVADHQEAEKLHKKLKRAAEKRLDEARHAGDTAAFEEAKVDYLHHQGVMIDHNVAYTARKSEGSSLHKAEGSRGGNIIGHTKTGKPIYGGRWSSKSQHVAHSEATPKGVYHVESTSLSDTGMHDVYFRRHNSKTPKRIGTANNLADAKAHIDRHQGQESVEKSEGSRGGHVIGHTKSGKPIYAPSRQHLEGAKGKHKAIAQDLFKQSAKGMSPQDHAEASDAHWSAMQRFSKMASSQSRRAARFGAADTGSIADDARQIHLHLNSMHSAAARKAKKSEDSMDMKKGGAGSRGGKVAYYTKTGKPVYESKVKKIAPQMRKMAENWTRNAEKSKKPADHATAAKQHLAAAFYTHHAGDSEAAQHHLDRAHEHRQVAAQAKHADRATKWYDEAKRKMDDHASQRTRADRAEGRVSPDNRAVEKSLSHDMHDLYKKCRKSYFDRVAGPGDGGGAAARPKPAPAPPPAAKKPAPAPAPAPAGPKPAAAMSGYGRIAKSDNSNEETSMKTDVNDLENLFKSEMGTPGHELETPVLDCPHCGEGITKSQVLAKATKKGTHVVEDNKEQNKGGSGPNKNTPVRGSGDGPGRSEAHLGDTVKSGEEPTVSKGQPSQRLLGGSEYVQYYQTSEDEMIAKSIAQNTLGEGALVTVPIDKRRQ